MMEDYKFSLYCSAVTKNGRSLRMHRKFQSVQDLNNFLVTYGSLLATDWLVVQHHCRFTEREIELSPEKDKYYEQELPF